MHRGGAGQWLLHRRTSGASLGVVLAVVSSLFVMGMVCAGVASSHLALGTQWTNAHTARNLAEAAASQGCARLLQSAAYGTGTSALDPSIVVNLPAAPSGASGQLSFDRARAEALGIPWSTNNLATESAQSGWNGTVVPGSTAHLVGVGRCNGVEHRVEVVLYVPRFPYAVGSSGPIHSNGGLLVAAVDSPDKLARGIDLISPRDLRQGSLLTNSTDLEGGRALVLRGEGNRITGDVQAAGNVELAQDTSVGGEVRANAAPVALPRVPITSYDTASRAGVQTLDADTYSGTALTLQGYNRREGNLTVQGELKLESGVLYVNGDVTLHGGVSGKGAVIATGQTTIEGGGLLGTDNMAALLSRGNIRITGSADRRACFQGLMYSEGDITTRYCDLSGVCVANRAAGEGASRGGVDMDNTRYIQLAQASSVTFEVTQTSTPTPTPQPSPSAPFIQVQLGQNKFATPRVMLDRMTYDAATHTYTYDESRWTDYVVWDYGPQGGPPAGVAPDVASMGAQIEAPFQARDIPRLLAAASGVANQHIHEYLATVPSPGDSPTPTPGGTPGTTTVDRFTIDLSRYVNLEDRIRVLLWRDL